MQRETLKQPKSNFLSFPSVIFAHLITELISYTQLISLLKPLVVLAASQFPSPGPCTTPMGRLALRYQVMAGKGGETSESKLLS
jgi:hypothetical protein